ncbi:hypothetical protein ABIB25_003162 [Nakamurella sp. UYEF19]|uniref:DUF5722 domain-containing protein n=1 Tax=Nakamurella sp. UYEF19 TaxID=1756392 RepID=UPI0033976172
MARSRACSVLVLLVTVAVGLSVTGGVAVSAAPARAATPATLPARAATAPVVASPAAVGVGITSVIADTTSITVVGSLPPADDSAVTTVDVYQLDPAQDDSQYATGTPVATISPSSASFRVSFPRLAEARDGYYSKYLAVAVAAGAGGADGTSSPLGDAHYVDDVRFTATNTYPFPAIRDKKGLQVEMTDDAEQLGVRHGAINVAFNQLMLREPVAPAATLTFTTDGRTFFFDRAYIESLDGQIKALSDNGALVDLILILYADSNPNSAFSELVHPDAVVGKGTVYAFNTKTALGLQYFKAGMQFLTQRYTRTDQRYGRALGYIVGNEVDSAYVWSNMGDQPLQSFLEYYQRAVRIAWLAARQAYNEPRVYVSLDHQWAVPVDPGQPLQSYAGKDVVDGLAALSRAEGDFPWGVAYHPYPQNLFNPAFWQDTQATKDFETPLITFKNIEVLPTYLRQGGLPYQGQQRRIILSEQGCNTPGDSLDAQKLQAACYAYAYYKVRFLDGIDAFILHRHVDHQAEGGLQLGLWTWDANRTDLAVPGDHKYLYDVFKYIDTSKSASVTNFALPIIGITSWQQVIPGFDAARLDQQALPRQVGTQVGARPVAPRSVSGFESGTDGWLTSDNASSIQRITTSPAAGKGALRVHFDQNLPAWSTDAKTWKGADRIFTTPVNASRTPHLGLAVRVPTPPPGQFTSGNVDYVQIRVYGTDGHVAFGLARVDANGAWTTLDLDLTAWPERSAIDRIKIWVRGTTDDNWLGSFDLDQITLSASVNPAPAVRNIDLTTTASSRNGVGATVAITVTNHDPARSTGSLVAVACDGVGLTPTAIPIVGIAGAGGTRTVTVRITRYQPADRTRPLLCFRYGTQQLPTVLTLPPPTETVLYGFEGGTEGWVAGQNVTGIAAVASFPNGPGTPHGGSGALDAQTADTDASAARTVSLTPAIAPDLSTAQAVVVWVDAYGGAPGATGYVAQVILHCGNDVLISSPSSFKTDQWNRVAVDVADWDCRNRITRVDVTFHAVGTTAPWNPHFQVDDVGWDD